MFCILYIFIIKFITVFHPILLGNTGMFPIYRAVYEHRIYYLLSNTQNGQLVEYDKTCIRLESLTAPLMHKSSSNEERGIMR